MNLLALVVMHARGPNQKQCLAKRQQMLQPSQCERGGVTPRELVEQLKQTADALEGQQAVQEVTIAHQSIDLGRRVPL